MKLERAVILWCIVCVLLAVLAPLSKAEEYGLDPLAMQSKLNLVEAFGDVAGLVYVFGYLAAGLIVVGLIRLILTWRG